jgi:hypothetical protein
LPITIASDEKPVIKALLEGMILKHEAKTLVFRGLEG